MRALVMNEKACERIAVVCEYALNHVVDREMQIKMIDGEIPSVGNDHNHLCLIDFGFRCVFSIENHQGQMARHLSVSVDQNDKLPHMEALKILASAFGFQRPDASVIWLERYDEHIMATNLLEIFEDGNS